MSNDGLLCLLKTAAGEKYVRFCAVVLAVCNYGRRGFNLDDHTRPGAVKRLEQASLKRL